MKANFHPDLPQLSSNYPSSKVHSGLIHLGRWAVCGLKWRVQDAPPGMGRLAEIMQKIPVVTHKALHALMKNRAIWDDLAQLFRRADTLDYDEFLARANNLFLKANIFIALSLPNNHLGIQRGARIGQNLHQLGEEDISFRKGMAILKQAPSLKSVFYEMIGIDILSLTEGERQSLMKRWESHDFSISGRVIIEEMDRPIDWMEMNSGRKYYHISRALLRGE